MLALVVGGDADVDIAHGGISVAEGNGGDVAEGGFLDGLMIGSGVGQDEEAGLAEGGLQLVRECARSVPSRDGVGPCVLGELQNRPLTVRPRRLHDDVLRVLNRHYHPCCQLQLLPCLPKIDHVYPCNHHTFITLQKISHIKRKIHILCEMRSKKNGRERERETDIPSLRRLKM